jgi:hypothetical protein
VYYLREMVSFVENLGFGEPFVLVHVSRNGRGAIEGYCDG